MNGDDIEPKPILRMLLMLACLAGLSACAHQPTPLAYDPPGFFTGLWHGLIAPFALFGSVLFDFRFYAFPNSGVGYDFGWFFGLGAWSSSGAAIRR